MFGSIEAEFASSVANSVGHKRSLLQASASGSATGTDQPPPQLQAHLAAWAPPCPACSITTGLANSLRMLSRTSVSILIGKMKYSSFSQLTQGSFWLNFRSCSCLIMALTGLLHVLQTGPSLVHGRTPLLCRMLLTTMRSACQTLAR